MASRPMNGVLSYARRAVLQQDGGGLTDGQLLEYFVAHRDEAAFEALVRRHGPMVLGVCRRVLCHTHDAEDAFQATFLVLVRKASSLLPRHRLGNWLYGVAYRAALKARAATLKRRAKESQAAGASRRQPPTSDSLLDLQALLDQELSRLPDKYREPVVLCELEGRSRKDVARQLGIPEGTLSSRLAAARRMLAKRLARHGFAIAGAGLGVALAPGVVSACLSPSLVSTTVRAAALLAAGASGVSIQVIALTEGVLRSMLLTKLKVVGTVLLTCGLICAGGTGLGRNAVARAQAVPEQAAKEAGRDQASAAKYEVLWRDLAGTDEAKAVRAILALAAAPKEAVALFRERLGPVKAEPQRVGRLLAELDAEEFARRQRASEELAYLGRYARPALEKALTSDLSAEARRRIQQLVDEVKASEPEQAAPASEGRFELLGPARLSGRVGAQNDIKAALRSAALWMRAARAAAVLEHIATPESRQVLQSLAEGEPDALPTKEAKAALDRLASGPRAP